MKILVNAVDFKKGLNKIKGLLPKKPKLEILEHVILRADNGDIELTASDLETTASVRVKGEVFEDGQALISKADIKMLQKFKGDLEISASGNKVVYLGSSTLESHIVLDVNDFPESDFKGQTLIFRDIAYELRSKLKIKSLAGNDPARPVLSGLHFNTHHIEACDGYRIARLRRAFDNPEPFIMPITAVKVLEKLLVYKHDFINFESSDGGIVVLSPNFSLSFKPLEGSLFRVGGVMHDDSKYKFKTDRKALVDYYTLANAIPKAITKITLADDSMALSTDMGVNSVDTSIGLEHSTRELDIAVRTKYFLDALKLIKEDEVELHFDYALGGMFIKVHNEEHFILPVRLSK